MKIETVLKDATYIIYVIFLVTLIMAIYTLVEFYQVYFASAGHVVAITSTLTPTAPPLIISFQEFWFQIGLGLNMALIGTILIAGSFTFELIKKKGNERWENSGWP